MDIQATRRIVIHGLFKRKQLIIKLSLVIFGTIALGTFLWPPQYEAASSVIIRSRASQDLISQTQRPQGNWTLVLNPKDEANTEIAIITSIPVLEAVVKSLKLYEPQPYEDTGFFSPMRNMIREGLNLVKWGLTQIGMVKKPSQKEAIANTVNNLRRTLWAEQATDSQIIYIKYRSKDPILARDVVNKVTEVYQSQNLNININRAQSSFYAEEIEKVKAELQPLQDQLVKLKEDSGLLSFDEQSKLILNKLSNFETTRSNIQKEVASLRSKVEKIQDLRRSKPKLLIPLPEMAQDVQVQDLENKLINLNYQLGNVGSRYTNDSRQVTTAKEQIAEVEGQIRKQIGLILERELAKLRQLQSDEQALDQLISKLKLEIEVLPAKEVALGNLTREINVKQETLAVLWKKYQDSLIEKNTDSRLENIKIVSLAVTPIKPAVPNVPLNLGLGLIFSLAISFGTALFLDYWNDSIEMPEDIELNLGVPVCGSIPEL